MTCRPYLGTLVCNEQVVQPAVKLRQEPQVGFFAPQKEVPTEACLSSHVAHRTASSFVHHCFAITSTVINNHNKTRNQPIMLNEMLIKLALFAQAARAQFEQEEGQGLVEYALIIALVSVALVAALTVMTGSITDIFDFISGTLDGAR